MSRNVGKVDPDALAEKVKDNYVAYFDVIMDKNEPVDSVLCVRKIKTADDLMQMPMNSYLKLAAGRDGVAHDSIDKAIQSFADAHASDFENDMPSFYPANLSVDEKAAVKSSVKSIMNIDISDFDESLRVKTDVAIPKFDKSDYIMDSNTLAERLHKIEAISNCPTVDINEKDLPF